MEREFLHHIEQTQERYGLPFFGVDRPLLWTQPGWSFVSRPQPIGELGEALVFGLRDYPWPLSDQDRAELAGTDWSSTETRVLVGDFLVGYGRRHPEAFDHVYGLHVVVQPLVRVPLVCAVRLPGTALALASEMATLDVGDASASYTAARLWHPVTDPAAPAFTLHVLPELSLLSRLRFSFHATVDPTVRHPRRHGRK